MSRSVLTASLLLPPSRAAADLGLMPRFPLDLLVSIPARPGVGSTYLRHLGLSLVSSTLDLDRVDRRDNCVPTGHSGPRTGRDQLLQSGRVHLDFATCHQNGEWS